MVDDAVQFAGLGVGTEADTETDLHLFSHAYHNTRSGPLVPGVQEVHSEVMSELWIQGCLVQRIMFRDGLVLNLSDYNELVISVPIDLTLPATEHDASEVVTVDPTAITDVQRPLFDFAGQQCSVAEWDDDDGSLHLQFSDGHRIDARAAAHHTAWELYGKYHGYAACQPRGKVHVVRHDVEDDYGQNLETG
ncbi:hypothetical protein MMAGJ_65720 [Mycolicibacterium mageritense]|uniref:Uncharacterized protein n=2 Tax=Mycobacteriaceae TaxID=1762 RepID=A0ABN5YHW4_MYCME|nr:hypothetical protein MMAGJ_65720 [Mycolicibacterium mageritense]